MQCKKNNKLFIAGRCDPLVPTPPPFRIVEPSLDKSDALTSRHVKAKLVCTYLTNECHKPSIISGEPKVVTADVVCIRLVATYLLLP